jgi:hypothetical protein
MLGAVCRADPMPPPPPPANLDNATFNQLVNDLRSNSFETRVNASDKLTGYVNPASATRLTVAQLQTLRNLASTATDPEQRLRAGAIMQEFVRLNLNTVAPAQALLNSLKFKDLDFDKVLVEGHFMLGPIKVGYTAGGIAFRDEILRKYNQALIQLSEGYTNNLVPALEALKKVVADLPKNYGDFLYFSKNGEQVKKEDVLKELDNAIKAGGDLIKKLNDSIGDPKPGPAKQVPVPGAGKIDTGETFRLTLNGPGVKPGNLTLLALAHGLAPAAPPAGSQFVGPVFDLSTDDTLAVMSGSIQVAIEYGDPALYGLPSSQASQFQLVHFANGSFTPFDSTFNDQSAFVLSGTYTPPSASSGLDQFGEFAIVQEIPLTGVPEPASLALLGLGLLVLVGMGWRYLTSRAGTCFAPSAGGP